MALRVDRNTVDCAPIAQDVIQRFQSTIPSPEIKQEIDDHADLIRGRCGDIAFHAMQNIEPSRELSLALTNLEQTSMWLIKALYQNTDA